MSKLSIFDFEGSNKVGVFVDSSQMIWFRVTDVCAILDFANPVVAVQTHAPGRFKEYKIGMGRPANYVSESGLYRLMLASKAPVAEKFRDWICDVLLPQIRETGSFGSVPNHDSQASEFWELIDGAIARNLPPEKAIALHQQYNTKAVEPVEGGVTGGRWTKKSEVGRSPRPLVTTAMIETKVLELSEKREWVAARDVQHVFAKSKRPNPGVIRDVFKSLAATGRGRLSGDGAKMKFSASRN